MSSDISVPAPDLRVLEVPLIGLSPLLQNPHTPSSMKLIEGDLTDEEKRDLQNRSAEEEVLEILDVLAIEGDPYEDDLEECVFGINSMAPKGAVVDAGRQTDRPMTELRQIIQIDAEGGRLPIESDPPVIDRRIVTVGRGSTKPAYRPKFHNWKVVVPYLFNPNDISVENLLQLIQIAGRSVGIGSFRAMNNGPFGRFRIGSDAVQMWAVGEEAA